MENETGIPSGQLRQETTPADYIKRGRALFEALDRFKTLRARIGKSMTSTTKEQREKFGSRSKMIEEIIINAYARAHFEDIEKTLAPRSLELALVYSQIFELIDDLSRGLK